MISKQLSVVAIIVLIIGIILGIASLWIFGYKYGMYSTYTDVTWASFGIGIGIAFISYVSFLALRGLSIVVEKNEIVKKENNHKTDTPEKDDFYSRAHHS